MVRRPAHEQERASPQAARSGRLRVALAVIFGRSRCRLRAVDRGRPATEKVQRLFGARAGFGGVGEDRQPVVCGKVHPVVAQADSPPQHRLHRRSSVTSPADHREAATLGPTATPSSGDRSLTVALLHLAPELGALDRNRSLIEYGTRVAADSGADWALSGELVVAGYRFEPLIGTNWIAEQPDSWMRRLARLSSDLGAASFVSHPERETPTGKLFNSLFVIGRNGQILGRHRKLKPTPGSEDWSSAGEPGRPIPVDGITIGLLVCADAYQPPPALRLRDSGAQLLVSAAAWWPGEWGPKGEWEARTLDTDLPMIVCNRTGCDPDTQLFDSESVVIDRGEKLLTLRATESTVFIVNCRLRQGHIAKCELIKSIVLKRERE